MFAFMTFKMNFNSTVIWRQFLTVSLFLWLKMGLSHWQVMSKVYVSKLNFLSVLDNQFWCTVFASFLKVSPQFDVFSTVKISQCNTFHWKGLRHDESMVFHSCSSVEHWRVAVMFWKLVCPADFFFVANHSLACSCTEWWAKQYLLYGWNWKKEQYSVKFLININYKIKCSNLWFFLIFWKDHKLTRLPWLCKILPWQENV